MQWSAVDGVLTKATFDLVNRLGHGSGCFVYLLRSSDSIGGIGLTFRIGMQQYYTVCFILISDISIASLQVHFYSEAHIIHMHYAGMLTST